MFRVKVLQLWNQKKCSFLDERLLDPTLWLFLKCEAVASANHVHSQIHRLYCNELTHFHKTFPRGYFSEHQSDWAGFTQWLCFLPDKIVATEKKIKGESSQHKTVDIRHMERKLNFPQKDQCSTANLLHKNSTRQRDRLSSSKQKVLS